MDSDLIELCIQTAKTAGCPRDQVENLLGRGYVPYPWQWKFHALARLADSAPGPIKIGAGGARGPGKTHAIMSQVGLDDCQRFPGLKALFLRQTGKSARESFEDVVGNTLQRKLKFEYNASNGVLKFQNYSKILLGGFEDEKDIDKYIGIEYDLMAIEELNQLTEEKVTKLEGSLRTSKENWRPRIYASFNPGGIGHQFVKNLFVEPFRSGSETSTRFCPATYRDNPRLNAEYVQYLLSLTGDLGKAWREGDWDLFAGQFFQEWSRERNVIRPFQIPSGWKRYRSYDHGKEKPATCAWYALDYDGRVWVYRELYIAGQNIDYIANEIVRLSTGEIYEYSIADPSIFAKHGFIDRFGGQTIAETFAHQGVPFIPGSNRRIDGWNIMHQYLYSNQHQLPKLIYFSTCTDSIRTIPTLIHDEHNPEDIDSSGEDHAADRDRYFLMSLHERSTEKPKTGVELKLAQTQKRDLVQPNLNRFYYG